MLFASSYIFDGVDESSLCIPTNAKIFYLASGETKFKAFIIFVHFVEQR